MLKSIITVASKRFAVEAKGTLSIVPDMVSGAR
jgi:hypothetical protein